MQLLEKFNLQYCKYTVLISTNFVIRNIYISICIYTFLSAYLSIHPSVNGVPKVCVILGRKSLRDSGTTGNIPPSVFKQGPDQEQVQNAMAHLTTEVLILFFQCWNNLYWTKLQTKFTGVCFSIGRMVSVSRLQSAQPLLLPLPCHPHSSGPVSGTCTTLVS